MNKTATPRKPKWLQPSPGPALPMLTLCLSAEEFDAAIKHVRCDDAGEWLIDGARATTHQMDRGWGWDSAIVCLDDSGLEPLDVVDMLAHEAVHVWQHYSIETMNDHDPSHEHEALVIQHVLRALLDEYIRKRGGGNR